MNYYICPNVIQIEMDTSMAEIVQKKKNKTLLSNYVGLIILIIFILTSKIKFTISDVLSTVNSTV